MSAVHPHRVYYRGLRAFRNAYPPMHEIHRRADKLRALLTTHFVAHIVVQLIGGTGVSILRISQRIAPIIKPRK